MKVKLVRQKVPEGMNISLTMGKEYEVLAIERCYYRILTDLDSKPYGNEPILFEQDFFEVTDPTEPDFWVTEYVDGQRYNNPFL